MRAKQCFRCGQFISQDRKSSLCSDCWLWFYDQAKNGILPLDQVPQSVRQQLRIDAKREESGR